MRNGKLSRLRDEREKRGWSQSELSFRCGIPQTLISHFESGYRTPTRDQLAVLARALQIVAPPSVLLQQAEILWDQEAVTFSAGGGS